MRTLSIVLAALAAAALVSQAAAFQQRGGTTYVAGGTAVVRAGNDTLADNGALVCSTTVDVGLGGGCIPWADAPGATAVNVTDASGRPVAYQVCIDNDGNLVCGGPQDPRCPDQIFFSHADGGAFFNPLGPLPTSFLSTCAGGFKGWVVFLCTGTHDDQTGSHSHAATTGIVLPAKNGSGFGNFCGDGGGQRPDPTVAKAYVIR